MKSNLPIIILSILSQVLCHNQHLTLKSLLETVASYLVCSDVDLESNSDLDIRSVAYLLTNPRLPLNNIETSCGLPSKDSPYTLVLDVNLTAFLYLTQASSSHHRSTSSISSTHYGQFVPSNDNFSIFTSMVENPNQETANVDKSSSLESSLEYNDQNKSSPDYSMQSKSDFINENYYSSSFMTGNLNLLEESYNTKEFLSNTMQNSSLLPTSLDFQSSEDYIVKSQTLSLTITSSTNELTIVIEISSYSSIDNFTTKETTVSYLIESQTTSESYYEEKSRVTEKEGNVSNFSSYITDSGTEFTLSFDSSKFTTDQINTVSLVPENSMENNGAFTEKESTQIDLSLSRLFSESAESSITDDKTDEFFSEMSTKASSTSENDSSNSETVNVEIISTTEFHTVTVASSFSELINTLESEKSILDSTSDTYFSNIQSNAENNSNSFYTEDESIIYIHSTSVYNFTELDSSFSQDISSFITILTKINYSREIEPAFSSDNTSSPVYETDSQTFSSAVFNSEITNTEYNSVNSDSEVSSVIHVNTEMESSISLSSTSNEYITIESSSKLLDSYSSEYTNISDNSNFSSINEDFYSSENLSTEDVTTFTSIDTVKNVTLTYLVTYTSYVTSTITFTSILSQSALLDKTGEQEISLTTHTSSSMVDIQAPLKPTLMKIDDFYSLSSSVTIDQSSLDINDNTANTDTSNQDYQAETVVSQINYYSDINQTSIDSNKYELFYSSVVVIFDQSNFNIFSTATNQIKSNKNQTESTPIYEESNYFSNSPYVYNKTDRTDIIYRIDKTETKDIIDITGRADIIDKTGRSDIIDKTDIKDIMDITSRTDIIDKTGIMDITEKQTYFTNSTVPNSEAEIYRESEKSVTMFQNRNSSVFNDRRNTTLLLSSRFSSYKTNNSCSIITKYSLFKNNTTELLLLNSSIVDDTVLSEIEQSDLIEKNFTIFSSSSLTYPIQLKYSVTSENLSYYGYFSNKSVDPVIAGAYHETLSYKALETYISTFLFDYQTLVTKPSNSIDYQTLLVKSSNSIDYQTLLTKPSNILDYQTLLVKSSNILDYQALVTKPSNNLNYQLTAIASLSNKPNHCNSSLYDFNYRILEMNTSIVASNYSTSENILSSNFSNSKVSDYTNLSSVITDYNFVSKISTNFLVTNSYSICRYTSFNTSYHSLDMSELYLNSTFISIQTEIYSTNTKEYHSNTRNTTFQSESVSESLFLNDSIQIFTSSIYSVDSGSSTRSETMITNYFYYPVSILTIVVNIL